MEPNIQIGLEGTSRLPVNIGRLGNLIFTVDLRDTFKRLIKAKLNKCATREQKPGGISCSPVGQTVFDAVAGKFMRVSGGENLVADDLGTDDLTDDL